MLGNSKIPSLRESKATEAISKNLRILDFSGVLGAAAPKGLERSPYKKQRARPTKASKNLEFLLFDLIFF